MGEEGRKEEVDNKEHRTYPEEVALGAAAGAPEDDADEAEAWDVERRAAPVPWGLAGLDFLDKSSEYEAQITDNATTT